jgi:hypothetical protein
MRQLWVVALGNNTYPILISALQMERPVVKQLPLCLCFTICPQNQERIRFSEEGDALSLVDKAHFLKGKGLSEEGNGHFLLEEGPLLVG